MAPTQSERRARGIAGSTAAADWSEKLDEPYYTIGHSTRSIEEFVELLQGSQVQMVIDVRTVPRSRTNPQYNRDTLGATLEPHQVGYEHIPELGGLRGKQRDGEASRNGFWKNTSFRNYADYAETDAFLHGMARLRTLGGERRVALMCAEAVWWRCHRRIIADHLLSAGQSVFHILGKNHVDPAKLNPGAKMASDGSLFYPKGDD